MKIEEIESINNAMAEMENHVARLVGVNYESMDPAAKAGIVKISMIYAAAAAAAAVIIISIAISINGSFRFYIFFLVS